MPIIKSWSKITSYKLIQSNCPNVSVHKMKK